MAVSKLKLREQSASESIRYSDEEILSRKFDIDNPESLDQLLRTIPDSSEVPSIEYQYHVKGGKDAYVYCAHCQTNTHNRGYVLKYSSGNRILVGKDCGSKNYGLAFNTALNEFKGQQNRASALLKRNSMLEYEPAFLSQLNALLSHPAIPIFEKLHRDFNTVAVGLTRKLQESAIRENGQLSIVEKVRDLAAEERRREDIELQIEESKGLGKAKRKILVQQGEIPSTKSRHKQIFKDIPRSIGRIIGVEFIIPRAVPSQALLRLAQRSKIFFEQIRLENQATKLNQLFREFDTIVEGIELETSRLRSPPIFFQSNNLRLIRQWAEFHLPPDDKMSLDNVSLVRFVSHTDTTTRCSLDSEYQVPEIEFISTIKRISKFGIE